MSSFHFIVVQGWAYGVLEELTGKMDSTSMWGATMFVCHGTSEQHMEYGCKRDLDLESRHKHND